MSDLTWDSNPKTYKAIFIAGNEPFTQGPVDPRQACRDGFSKGVIINTIHCGSRNDGISGSWHDGAALAGGKFMIIDQDRAVCHIDAPQDKKISELGESNSTRPISVMENSARKAWPNNRTADQGRHRQQGRRSRRAARRSKASANYHNASWDLVDAVREKKLDVASLPKDELPESLRDLEGGGTQGPHR